jgi:hypothetical protein
MPETKGSLLRFSIAFALSNVRLQVGQRFFKLGLSEEQRYEVAETTIRELRKQGYKDLDEVVLPPPVTPR